MKQLIRNLFNESDFFSYLYLNYYWRKKYPLPDNPLTFYLLNNFSKRNKKVNFVQIGSNDGVLADPLHHWIKKYKWTGILVEPVEHIFSKLKENYRGCENLIFENVALSDKKENLTFYYLDDRDALINSFDSSLVERILAVDSSAKIKSKVIECITFDNLVNKHHFTDIDLIHIDAEGYDCKILKSIDFETFSPKIILFEHTHSKQEELDEAYPRFKKSNYSIVRLKNNSIALKRQCIDEWLFKYLIRIQEESFAK